MRDQHFEFKERVKKAVSLKEVVEELANCQFKKSGKNWVTNCPFGTHEDKNPSFTVFGDDRGYRCYGCDQFGDVYNFVQKLQLWDFGEALEWCANKAGLKVTKTVKKGVKSFEESERHFIQFELEKELREGRDSSRDDKECLFRDRIPQIAKLDPIGKKRIARILKEDYDISDGLFKSMLRQHEATVPKAQFNPRPYTEEILKSYFLQWDKYKRFWIYDKTEGIWEQEAEDFLNSVLRKKILGSKDYRRYCIEEIIADLKGLTRTGKQIQEPPPYLIPFKNKIYHLGEDKFLNFSPEFFFVNKLAVDIDPDKRECPHIEQIFRDLVEPEDVITLYEIIAYALYRQYPYPKMFILYGPGANGKTTYVRILEKIFGLDNISGASADGLQHQRFATSQLFGKMVNVSGEMEYSILKRTSILKQCCGLDIINAERKFREPFPFINYAKMIFLTNQVPVTGDRTFAFYRRMFMVEFPRQFIMGKNADLTLVDKIPLEEFNGLAWKCLEIMKKLYFEQGFIFTRHEDTERTTEKYEDLSNPLGKFLEEYIRKEPSSEIPVEEFAERFEGYLKEKGFRPWNARERNREMKEKGYESKKIHLGEGTRKCWIGLKWL